jgi:hypothetical protein
MTFCGVVPIQYQVESSWAFVESRPILPTQEFQAILEHSKNEENEFTVHVSRSQEN